MSVEENKESVRKFSHLKEADIANFQEMVNQRYALIKGLCELSKSQASS